MKNESKNESKWKEIFEKHDILDNIQKKGLFKITAAEINLFREARLMTKYDTKESLPKIFKDNKLSIVAIKNGVYYIFFDEEYGSFLNLPDYSKVEVKQYFPKDELILETLAFNKGFSEFKAIDYAHHYGLLNSYTKEEFPYYLTTRGRFFSNKFQFDLNKNIKGVKVEGVQIEIDSGYESKNNFLIIEAKSSTRETFNIRQLYFPFQHFKQITKKVIKNVLLSYSNGIYYLTEIFIGEHYHESKIISNHAFEIVLEKQKRKISLQELLTQSTFTPPEEIPVPQADDLNKVIDLLYFLNKNPSNKFQVAEYFEIHERQGDYYPNAARYLGLIERKKSIYELNEVGLSIIKNENRLRRNELLVKQILKTKLFNDLMREFVKHEGNVSDDFIVQRLRKEPSINKSTPIRRKSTMRSWMKWIYNNYLKK